MDAGVINRFLSMANNKASSGVREVIAQCDTEIRNYEDSVRVRKNKGLCTEEEETYIYNLKIAKSFLQRYKDKIENNTSIFI